MAGFKDLSGLESRTRSDGVLYQITKALLLTAKNLGQGNILEDEIFFYDSMMRTDKLEMFIRLRARFDQEQVRFIQSEISQLIMDKTGQDIRAVVEVLPVNEIITVKSAAHPEHFRTAQDLYAASIEYCARYEITCLHKLRVYYSVPQHLEAKGYPRAYYFNGEDWEAIWEVVPMGRSWCQLKDIDKGRSIAFRASISNASSYQEEVCEPGEDEELYSRLVSLGIFDEEEALTLRTVAVSLPISLARGSETGKYFVVVKDWKTGVEYSGI